MSDVTPIAPRDVVRHTTTDTTRIVRQINPTDSGDMLLVRAREEDEKSHLWTWRADNCVLVNPAPEIVYNVHDRVTLGTGSVVREIKDTRVHSVTGELQYRVDVADEKEKWVAAVALHPVAAQVAPVADKMKATESTADDALRAGDPLFRAAQELANEMEKTRAAEERAKVAELQIKKLEQIIREHEARAMKPSTVVAGQPIPQMAACYEIKIVKLNIELPESAKQWATLLDEGWKENHIASVIDSNDTVWQIVTFKKPITTSPQPERGSAGHHADLTAPFVNERTKPAIARESVEFPAVGTILVENKKEIKLGPIGTSIKEIGREETSQMMTDFALDKAFAAGRARIDAMPDFNRPLHSLKASN